MTWLVEQPQFFVIFCIAGWVSVVYLLALVSGWNALAKRFRLKGRFYGETFSFRSAQMRFTTNYGSCLTIGADASGPYLSVFPIFRLGQPPLLIPWSEVTVISGEKGLIFKKRELRLGREESIPLRISSSLAESVRQCAGTAWPVETVAT